MKSVWLVWSNKIDIHAGRSITGLWDLPSRFRTKKSVGIHAFIAKHMFALGVLHTNKSTFFSEAHTAGKYAFFEFFLLLLSVIFQNIRQQVVLWGWVLINSRRSLSWHCTIHLRHTVTTPHPFRSGRRKTEKWLLHRSRGGQTQTLV